MYSSIWRLEMNLSKKIFLISAISLFSCGLQLYPAISKELVDPMTEEEHQYFKKYIGAWGGSTWGHFQVRASRDRDVEIRIRKIEVKKRKASLAYSLGESDTGLPASPITRMASCIEKKIYFSSTYNKFELALEGRSLRATRIGTRTQGTFLKRMPPMKEEELIYFEKMNDKWRADGWESTGIKNYTNKDVQMIIGKINADERTTSVTYFLGEGVAHKASEKTFPAECIQGEIVFFTGKNRIELVQKGNQIWAERIGPDPARAALSRMK
jgi:hypothetical protein